MLRRVLPAMVLGAFVALSTQAPAMADNPTKQIYAVLDGVSCQSGQVATKAYFTLTGLGPSPIPSSITVNTDVSALTAQRDSLQSGTATFSTALDANLKQGGTFATVNAGWRGRFYLSNLDCATAAQPGLSVTSSQCGTTPALTVQVTNNNGSGTQFSVDVGHFPERSVYVLGHHTESVVFSGIPNGTYAVSIKGGDGTGANTSVNFAPCPSPSAAASSADPSPTPTREHSPKASPSASASTDPSVAALPMTDASSSADTPQAAGDPSVHTAASHFGASSALSVMAYVFGSIMVAGGVWLLVWMRKRNHAHD